MLVRVRRLVLLVAALVVSSASPAFAQAITSGSLDWGVKASFRSYVEGSVAERIFKRAEYAMTELTPHTNPYLAFIFTGNYRDVLPRYLRDLGAVRRNLEKLTLVRGPIDEAATGHFDGFYLSDIFEYVDPATHAAMYERLLASANPGTRLAYWNLLVPRRVPPQLAPRVRELREEASPTLLRPQAEGTLAVVGAFYSLGTGVVDFFDLPDAGLGASLNASSNADTGRR